MKLYCDIKTAIKLTNNHILHDKEKHVEINCHFIRRKIDFNEPVLPYVKSINQLTDVFTKGLSSIEIEQNVSKLNIFYMYVQLEGMC